MNRDISLVGLFNRLEHDLRRSAAHRNPFYRVKPNATASGGELYLVLARLPGNDRRGLYFPETAFPSPGISEAQAFANLKDAFGEPLSVWRANLAHGATLEDVSADFARFWLAELLASDPLAAVRADLPPFIGLHLTDDEIEELAQS